MNASTKLLKKMCIISAIITSALGIALHFAYDFFDNSIVVGLFSPINESTWEHLKLLFFPMLLCILIWSFKLTPVNQEVPGSATYNRSKAIRNCYFFAAFISLYCGCLLIITLFYTISGIIGTIIDWLNIGIYILCVILAYFIFYLVATKPLHNTYYYYKTSNNKKNNNCPNKPAWISILAIAVLMMLFFLFTFYPPDIGLFRAP